MATRRAEDHFYTKQPMTPPRNISRTFTSSPFSVGSSSISPSDTSSWRNSGGSSATEFEDICSISDSNSEIVPLKVSDSVKKLLSRSGAGHGRPPSLSIPSPMAWSTIGAPQDSALMLTASTIPPPRLLTPNTLTMLPSSHFGWRTPRCNTPSLDSSYNSVGDSSANSPSTPISVSVKEECWDSAVQLQSKAMDVLFQLSPDFQHCDFGPMLDPYKEPQPEMVEHNKNTPRCCHLFQEVQDMEPLSAISIPSPGGFFASLGAASQQVWGTSTPANIVIDLPNEALCTTTAEAVSSNDVPCTTDPENKPIHEVTLHSHTIPQDVDVPETDVKIHKEYDQIIDQLAASNSVRTKLWLIGQETYLSGLLSPHPVPERTLQFPSSPAPESCELLPAAPSTKKTVHFVSTPIEIPSPQPTNQRSDPLLYHTFQYFLRHSHASDVYTQRHSRLATMQTNRMHLPTAHTAFLRNTYALPPTSPRRTEDSPFLYLDPTIDNIDAAADAQRDLIARASREREMLQQVSPTLWHLHAWRTIHGGNLLVPAAQKSLSRKSRPRVLDICASGPAAGWGWAVAIDYRHAQVSTVVPHGGACSGTEDGWRLHREPSNHFTVPVANVWTLPFAEDSFDVVSARSLHMLLHTHTDGTQVDEWKAMLNEIHRVLAPNGVFQFSLLDAEVKVKTKATNKPHLPTSPQPTAQKIRQIVSPPPKSPLPPQPQHLPLHPKPSTSSSSSSSSQTTDTTFTSLNNTFLTILHALNYHTHPISTFPHLLATTNFLDTKHARLELPLNATCHNNNNSIVIEDGKRESSTETGADIGALASLVGLTAYESWVLSVEDEMEVKKLNAVSTSNTTTIAVITSSPSSSSSHSISSTSPTLTPKSLLPQIALAAERQTSPPYHYSHCHGSHVDGGDADCGVGSGSGAYIRMLIGCARKGGSSRGK